MVGVEPSRMAADNALAWADHVMAGLVAGRCSVAAADTAATELEMSGHARLAIVLRAAIVRRVRVLQSRGFSACPALGGGR